MTGTAPATPTTPAASPGAAGSSAPAGAVVVRPFAAADFDQVVDLMPPEWRFDGTAEREWRAQRRMDCAGMLASCNERLVAVAADGDGERVAGLLFARIEGLPAPADAHLWKDVAREARATLAAGSAEARRALAYIEQLGERGDLLVKAAGDAMGPDNELELFAVGPLARGRGAGGALMGAFERHLAELGAPSYWLQTDTSCTWEWYERHGYVRVADVELDGSFAMPPMVCAAPDEGADGPAHVFMYRKGLG